MGKGAFRRFKDVFHAIDDEWVQTWYRWKDDRLQEAGDAWLRVFCSSKASGIRKWSCLPKEAYLCGRRGCVRTENTGIKKKCWRLLARSLLDGRPPASWPSKRPIGGGTPRVAGQGKPVASSLSGPERTGALQRRRGRSARPRPLCWLLGIIVR